MVAHHLNKIVQPTTNEEKQLIYRRIIHPLNSFKQTRQFNINTQHTRRVALYSRSCDQLKFQNAIEFNAQ